MIDQMDARIGINRSRVRAKKQYRSIKLPSNKYGFKSLHTRFEEQRSKEEEGSKNEEEGEEEDKK